MEIVTGIIVIVTLLVLSHILPKLLKLLFWILIIATIIILVWGISYGELFNWAKNIVLYKI